MDYQEVAKHNTRDSCWVVLYENVYDVTKFLPNHPGGQKIILQLAGQDATEAYDPVHPPGTLDESLDASANLGKIDTSTLPAREDNAAKGTTAEDQGPPPLDTLLNLDDIEREATKRLSRKAWAYYFSASDDLYTKTLNHSVYRQVLLRPRVFVDCTDCDSSSTILGNKLRSPFFISPAAMARLAHPSGEQGIAAACGAFGAAQIVSNNASMTPEQIVENAPRDQVFGWQLYVQNERSKSEAMLARINKMPNYKFIVLTLDAPVPGKREDDERAKNEGAPMKAAVQQDDADANKNSSDGGLGKALFAGTAADLTWRITLPWLARHTHLPIILKGLQTHEDAYLAAQHAPQVRGIILSNHGGRAADTAPPPLHVLLEIRKYCPHVLRTLDVLVDGGIKRGTDAVKALALGAKAVGLGRAPLYSLAVGGRAGVERMLAILKEETETTMRLLGVKSVAELNARHVNTRAVERDVYDGPSDVGELSLQSKL